MRRPEATHVDRILRSFREHSGCYHEGNDQKLPRGATSVARRGHGWPPSCAKQDCPAQPQSSASLVRQAPKGSPSAPQQRALARSTICAARSAPRRGVPRPDRQLEAPVGAAGRRKHTLRRSSTGLWECPETPPRSAGPMFDAGEITSVRGLTDRRVSLHAPNDPRSGASTRPDAPSGPAPNDSQALCRYCPRNPDGHCRAMRNTRRPYKTHSRRRHDFYRSYRCSTVIFDSRPAMAHDRGLPASTDS